MDGPIRDAGISRRLIAVAVVGLISMCSVTPAAAAPESSATKPTRPPADFNGDGYRDLAVSKRDSSTGLVQVFYGSPTGFTATASRQWGPQSFGADISTGFGSALTTGDFDGDGYSDLAIGDPLWEPVEGWGGYVVVIYGSASGLNADRAQQWSQSSPGVRGRPERKDQFGADAVRGQLRPRVPGRSCHRRAR